ncbi:MAG: hypothetical protein E6J73_02620 [Deltaproteobacteria bacterium]|nr:MAG: hypothetical protein E6J73_02620 [Deltaproteobacteria bacterium]
MALELYRKKRDFKTTPEPKGKLAKAKKRDLVFVIQKHAATRLHYDFRLELSGVLLSWAVQRQAARHARGRSPAGVRRFRRHYSPEAVRRRNGDALGPRHLDPEGGSHRGLQERQTQVRSPRRKTARRLDPGKKSRQQVRRRQGMALV